MFVHSPVTGVFEHTCNHRGCCLIHDDTAKEFEAQFLSIRSVDHPDQGPEKSAGANIYVYPTDVGSSRSRPLIEMQDQSLPQIR
jgi:hypothetical protein